MNAAFLLLFLVQPHQQAPVKEQAVKFEQVRDSVRSRLDELRRGASFPGMTAGFVLPDGRSGSVAVGLADLQTKTPMKPGDRILAGSIGKTFFSAVALQLVAEGKTRSGLPYLKMAGNGAVV